MPTRRSLLVNSLATAVAAGAFSQSTTGAFARAAIIGKQAPGFYRFRFGTYEVTAISDGTINLPMSKIYRNITERDAEAYLAERFQSHPAEFSINAFLVNTGERLVLIDTGTGELMGPSLGKAVSNIQAAGYRPSQIDDIILTHIHADHSGGLVANGARVFENAVVRVNRREERSGCTLMLPHDLRYLDHRSLRQRAA
jgi:glyoxylase-like metal-dependent hydrolase (beta-lactamase superfamily II)